MNEPARTAVLTAMVALAWSVQVHAQSEAERIYWDSVNCDSEIEVRAYLEQFPGGAFTDEAFECIRAADEQSEKEKVAERLETCRIHFEANRLTTGAGGTALDCYRSVLEVDADNVDALSGLNEIENTYIRWARADLEAGNVEGAQRNLDSLKKLNPERREITTLHNGIAELRREALEAERREEEAQKRLARERTEREREAEKQREAERQRRELEAAKQEAERQRQALEQARLEEEKERRVRQAAEEAQAAAAAAAAAAQPKAFATQLKLIQQSGGQCVLWGCVATIEIYLDGSRVFELVRRLDLPIEQIVWQGQLAAGQHDLRTIVHYKGKRREEFNSRMNTQSANTITVYVGHVGKLLTGHFHPQIQAFYGGSELFNIEATNSGSDSSAEKDSDGLPAGR
jgi:hypothetical protein